MPDGVLPYDELAGLLRGLFADGRAIVGVCAAGILIRLLAPLLGDKRDEPPVVALADDGSSAVPLLGGHRGGNRLACTIAEALGGHAAITTAGDLRLGLALDAPPAGWSVRNPEAAKAVTAALLAGEAVALRVEAGEAGWLAGVQCHPAGSRQIILTDRDAAGAPGRLVLHPAVLALGVGCERGVEGEELVELALRTLAGHGLARAAVACVVSLELKADEAAVHALARHLGVPARFLPAAALEAEAPRLANPSAAVFAATGCHGVAEGAALAAVGAAGELLVAKTRSARATLAIGRAPRPLDPLRIGRPQGRLAVVGLGPGDAAWRTPEATRAARRGRGLGRLPRLSRAARDAARHGAGAPRLRARRGAGARRQGARARRRRAPGRAGQLGRRRNLRHGGAGLRDSWSSTLRMPRGSASRSPSAPASRRCRRRRRARAPRSAMISARSRSPTC